MEAALEKHALTLDLNLIDYNKEDFNAKNRQASVAQYMIDSRLLKGSALTVEDIQTAFVNGVAYEKGKLAFSTKLMDDVLSVTDFEALRTVYSNEVTFRGRSPISDTALAAIDKALGLNEMDQASLIQDLEDQFSVESEAGQNPFKINDVFTYINQYGSQG